MSSYKEKGAKLYMLASRVLFPLLLALYPLRHIRYGVEWWDTGYNYGNFMFMEYVDPMWLYSTYLANALGNLFTRLPFGNYMIGLNIYTGLTVSILALMGYAFFTYKNRIPAWIVFIGEFLAVSLCWCPTALLYNYLTYILFGAGVIALYFALLKDTKGLFLLAGIFLGVNVFVRFSNLAEMALILGVWAYAYIRKSGFVKTALQTGWCVLGYLLGAGGGLGIMALRYGLKEYVSGIVRLLSMPSEASDYTLISMIYGQLTNYLENFKWFAVLLAVVLICLALWAVLPGRLIWVKRILTLAAIPGSFCLLYSRNVFMMEYTSTRSIFHWAVFLQTLSLIAGLVILLRKKAPDEEKLQAGLCMLVLLITPLGSNNQLYASINNMFLVAPWLLWILYRFLQWLPGEAAVAKGKLRLAMFPVRSMLLGILLMAGLQSLLFGFTYVFMESKGGENLDTRIENNDILKGMYADAHHARDLGGLTEFVKENGLEGRESLIYGYIPAVAYYMNMPCVLSAWPDLRSYNSQVMEERLQALSLEIASGEREKPVMILELQYGAWLEGGEEALAALGSAGRTLDKTAEQLSQDRKWNLLIDWAREYNYRTTYKNDKLVVLEAE